MEQDVERTPKQVHLGFKLFYEEDTRKNGRLMTPQEVARSMPTPEHVLFEEPAVRLGNRSGLLVRPVVLRSARSALLVHRAQGGPVCGHLPACGVGTARHDAVRVAVAASA